MQGNELWRSSLGEKENDSLNSVIKVGNEYIAVGSIKNDGIIFRAIDEYNITLNKVENGKVTVESKALVGSTVKIKVEANEEYELKEIKVENKDGKTVEIDKNNYTFIMPESDVTISVIFEKKIIPSEQPDDSKDILDKEDTTIEQDKDTQIKEEQKDNSNNGATEKPKVDTEIPATGDNVFIYVIISIVAIVGIVAVFIINKKQKNK